MVRLQETTFRKVTGDKQLDYPVKGPVNSNLGFFGIFKTLKLQRSNDDQADQVKNHVHQIALIDVRPKEDREGIQMIIHDPYNVASDKSVNFFTLNNQEVDYLIAPKIVMIDETLEGYDLKE
jgi:hypothetical protein